MEIAQHIEALERDGGTLAEAASQAGLGADVPTCPGWTVADLIKHTGYVHRWAARNIIEQPDAAIDDDSEQDVLAGGPADAELLGWFRDGYAALAGTLRAADPAMCAPVFLPNTTSPLGFWARRQAHETGVHRADAELAAGRTPAFDSDFAADGIDELIMGFAARTRRPPAGGEGRSMLIRAADAAAERGWRITWAAEKGTRGTAERVPPGDDRADCVLTGPAAGLYLTLWNRVDMPAAHVTAEGDPAVAAAWREVQVRW